MFLTFLVQSSCVYVFLITNLYYYCFQHLENELVPLQENAQIVNKQIEKLKNFSSMENELHSLRKQVAIYK